MAVLSSLTQWRAVYAAIGIGIPSPSSMTVYTPIWEEPVRGGYPDPSMLMLSGLERLRAMVKGQTPRPPASHLIGMRPVEAGVGTCTFLTPATEWLQSQMPHYSGGVGALVSDAALGSAVMSGVNPWEVMTTSQLSMSFLRPAGPWSGRLSARAKLIHTTPTVGLSEVHVEDGEGRLVAHGTSRCFIQRIPQFEVQPFDPTAHIPPTYDTPDPYLRPVHGTVASPDLWKEWSGLQFVRGLKTDESPRGPIAELFGYQMEEVEEGGITMSIPNREWWCNPARMVYGGITSNVIHDAMAMALHSTLPKATTYSTLDLTVNFVRPIPPDGEQLHAKSHVVHRGRTFAVTSGQVSNAKGKTVATGSASWIILEGRPFPDQRDYAREFPPTS